MAFSSWSVVQSRFTGTSLRSYNTDAYGLPIAPVITTTYPGADLFPTGSPLSVVFGHPSISTHLQAEVSMVPDGVHLQRGFAYGQISCYTQQIANVINGVPQPTGPMNWGITCLQNQASMVGGSGECYALMMDTVNFGNVVRLIKMTAGISFSPGGSEISTYIVLAETTTNFFNNVPFGNYSTLSLQWFSDPYFLKGTHLIASYNNPGVSTSTVFDIVHTGSQAIINPSPVAEGIYAQGATNLAVVAFSNIRSDKFTVNTINGIAYPPP